MSARIRIVGPGRAPSRRAAVPVPQRGRKGMPQERSFPRISAAVRSSWNPGSGCWWMRRRSSTTSVKCSRTSRETPAFSSRLMAPSFVQQILHSRTEYAINATSVASGTPGGTDVTQDDRAPQVPAELEARIREARPRLNARRQRLIRSILDRSDETVFLSSREMARQYQVDAATIVRTVQALGYRRFS